MSRYSSGCWCYWRCHIGNAVASRLGDHNGFQYVVDIEDSAEDISIVQSGDEQIPIGSKVTISIGTNTRIIISE